jgi:hypothetical protein
MSSKMCSFENQGSSWKFVDRRIIMERDRGLNEKVTRIFGLELFSNGKRCELGPWIMDHGFGRFPMDPGHGHGGELVGAPVLDRFQQRGPHVRWGKGRGHYGGFYFAYYRGMGGGASARKGDDMGVVEGRRRVGVWGASPGSGLPLYRGEGEVMRTSIHLIHLHHIKIIMPLLQPRDPMMKSELDPLHELVQS